MATELTVIDPQEIQSFKQDGMSLIEQARQIANAIADTPTLQRAADMMLEAKRRVKIIEQRFKEPKRAAKLAHTEICNMETELCEPYTRVEIEIIKPAMAAFESEQGKKRRAEEEKQMAEARKKAEDERLAAAAELEKSGEKEVANQLMEAPVEVAPVVMPKVETPSGISYRTVWKYRIVNASLIPREYYVLDERRIQQRVNSLKGDANIPGIKIYTEKQVNGRV